jgi:hypothetical protein
MENQRNHQGEVVDNQTVNKTNKHLKNEKRKKHPQYRNCRISVLVLLVLLLWHLILFVCISYADFESASSGAGALLGHSVAGVLTVLHAGNQLVGWWAIVPLGGRHPSRPVRWRLVCCWAYR